MALFVSAVCRELEEIVGASGQFLAK